MTSLILAIIGALLNIAFWVGVAFVGVFLVITVTSFAWISMGGLWPIVKLLIIVFAGIYMFKFFRWAMASAFDKVGASKDS